MIFQIELERANAATSEINNLETQLDVRFSSLK